MDLSSIFKAYDIRGLSPGPLDEDAAWLIGAAFAALIDEPTVAVGHDCRHSSPGLVTAFTDGVCSAGTDVWDVGLTTTDMVYFISGSESVAGAMVTASHNPPEWNGIKLCRSGAAPVGEDSGLAEIRRRAETAEGRLSGTGNIEKRDFADKYVDHVLSVVGSDGLRPLQVVADGGNGMAGVVLEDIFERIEPRLDGLYLEPDGSFPNHPADPLQTENLQDLIARVGEAGADLGVAFDGDADRAFFVDDRSAPLSGSTTTAMVARWFLAREPGATVVHNLITSRAVPETIARYGGTAVRTRVGHSFIKQVMADTEAIFGGEHSGHYYFRDNYRADSGILAMLVLMKVLSEESRPLSDLRGEFEPYSQSGEINLEVPDQTAAMREAEGAFDGEVDYLDGVTVAWQDRWFNLRPSNTEPVLRLNVEAPHQGGVQELVAQVTSVIGGQ